MRVKVLRRRADRSMNTYAEPLFTTLKGLDFSQSQGEAQMCHETNRDGAVPRASRCSWIVSSILAAAAQNISFAQTASDAEAEEDLPEVIVTVQRYSQSLQDVAATVQSFDGAELEKLGVNTDFRNLQAVVPGLNIANQEGKLEIFLRGIGSTDSDFSSDPSVATHYNGVYLPRPRSIGPMFFDTQRVEINKGPQGTLRGRNATGGSINIISNQPSFDGFAANTTVGLGSYDSRFIEAALNAPLSETFAARVAVYSESHDSYYSNAYGSGVAAPGSQDDTAGRVTLLWQPLEAFSANVVLWKSSQDGSGEPGAFSGRSLGKGYDIDDLADPWNQWFRTTGEVNNDLEGAMATVTYDFSSFSVQYIGSYNQMEFYNRNASREWQLGMNFPGSELEAYYTANTGNANPARLNWNDTFFQAEDSESRTHELRLFSDDSGKLRWSTGAFLFKEDFSYVSWDVGNGFFGASDWFQPGTTSGWQNGLGGENRGNGSEVESTAFYLDGTFSVTERFRVLAGARYTEDEKTANEFNAQYQFVFENSLLQEFGITDPSQISINGNGFRLRAPGARTLNDPVVCSEFTFAGLQCEGGVSPAAGVAGGLDFFFDGVESFGAGDNWDDFFRECNASGRCYAVIRSDFPGGARTSRYKGHFTDWRGGVEFDITDDFLLYGTVTTGHRAGGINRPITLANGTVLARDWQPEKLTNFEVGLKNIVTVFGHEARISGAAFYYDYKDKVVQNLVAVPVPRPDAPNAVTNLVFSDNSADANIIGLELDGAMNLPAGFNLGWNLSYLDSEFTDSALYDDRSAMVVSIDGNQLPQTSKYNANLRLGQTLGLNWGSVTSADWTLNLLWRSKFYLTPFNSKGYALDANGNQIEVPLASLTPNLNDALTPSGGSVDGRFFSDEVDAVALLNLNAGVNFGDEGRFRIDGYVANLTDEAYSGKGFINSSVNIRFLNSPRTWGVRMHASF